MYIEYEHTELKSSLTKEVKKEIIAFANTNGGKIYIGIDDDGNVVGLKSIKDDIEALSGMVRDGIKSDLTLYTNIEQAKINEKDVIILNVMEGPNKPYYLSDKGIKPSGVYLRYGNTSIPASEEVIKKMIIESQNNSFESMVSQNQNLHFEYLTKIFEEKGISLSDEKLKTLNIINLYDKYTNLGVLLSDECPFSIKCAIFEGKNDIKFKDRKEFTGSVLKQANDVYDYLNIYNRISSNIVGLERIDIRDYPEYALREAILNAIIHRDYNYTGSILSSLYDDHFELTSLGSLVKGLAIDDLYFGVSQTRNPNLADIFYRLRYVESFGTGIKRIIETYENYDKKPLLLCSENAFKITLYNVNYEEKALKYLKQASEATGLLTVSEIMDATELPLMMDYIDVLQIGARNMQNFKLLKAVGQCKKPVILKRGLSSTIREFLLAAEHIMYNGNSQVILCERGIRSFDSDFTRNVMDIASIPVIRKYSHLPIIVDPSHGTGQRYLIEPMAKAGLVVGASGVMIEVHNDPENALSDGKQSLSIPMFKDIMGRLNRFINHSDGNF